MATLKCEKQHATTQEEDDDEDDDDVADKCCNKTDQERTAICAKNVEHENENIFFTVSLFLLHISLSLSVSPS